MGLVFIGSGILTRDLLVGLELLFEKKKGKKNKVTLMSANLRLSVTCAVSNVGDVPTHPPIAFESVCT